MDIKDNTSAGRLEAHFDEGVAELTYRVQDERLVINYVGVPPQLGGQGIGGKMVAAALRKAAEENLAVVPVCPFARSWLQRNPDAAEKVEVASI